MTPSNEETDLVGQVVLGRYRIVRQIARGGMGMIYLARSEGAADFVRPVVVKRMLSDFVDPGSVRMFKREARIMSMLRHPGIVSVTDFGLENGSYLLVMDYVHGFHLGRWAAFVQRERGLREGEPGQLPWPIAVHVCIQVLDALEYAHTMKGPEGNALNIVHRDVSPSNVLLDVEGRVLLADFGIAKSSVGEEETKTTVGTVKGKFSYLAPEILDGAPPLPSADVYATAVVLHEVLVGRNEFRTPEPAATIQRVLGHTPRRLDVVRPDIPSALADVVARALLKRPEERFETAAELAKVLRRLRGIDAEEANSELRRLLDRDFHDRRFAPMFEMPELDALEQSWRTTPDAALERLSSPDLRRSSQPTKLARPGREEAAPTPAADARPPVAAPTPAADARGARSPRLLAGGLAVLALGLVVTAAVWLTRPPEEPRPVVFVEANPNGLVTQVPAVEPPDASVAPDAFVTPARADRPPRDPQRPPRQADDSPGQTIDRVFGRHTGAIRACFEGAEPPEGPIYLRFTTDASGDVESLEITPDTVGSGAVGRCVAGAARRIAFGRAIGARTFRIPITVRAQ